MFTRNFGKYDSVIDDYVLARIDYRVKRLAIRLDLSDDQRDDYAQTMAAAVLSAASTFDQTKAQWRTFVSRVLDNCIKAASRSEINRRHRACSCPISFDDIAEGSEPVVNEGRKGQITEVERVDMALDVQQIVSRMPRHLQQVCELLGDCSVSEIAKIIGKNRTSVYRNINTIREIFIEADYDFSDFGATKVA